MKFRFYGSEIMNRSLYGQYPHCEMPEECAKPGSQSLEKEIIPDGNRLIWTLTKRVTGGRRHGSMH
ncbi:hypothetical protein J2741_001341 [Methanolinea mesophila]|nr:hypothetical protein [Methanolinea mesophila]